MIFIHFLILNYLPQLIYCEESRTCEFSEAETISNIVENMASPSKGLFDKFGININLSDFLGIDPSDQGIDINQFFFDSLSFAIIFAIFFALFFLYFLFFGISNCCCCCHAKNSKKPRIVLIIFHFLGIALLVITAILIFLSSTKIVKSINTVKDFPNNLNNEIDGIFNQLNNTISNTFDSVERNVDNFIGILNNFTNWLNSSSTINNENAINVIPIIAEYNDTFATGEYMKAYTQLLIELEGNEQLYFDLKLMNESREAAIEIIIELSNTLINATNDISNTTDNIQKTLNDSILTIKNRIDGFRNDTVNDKIDEIKESVDTSSINLDEVEDICDTLLPILKIVLYVIACFILLIVALYSGIFFCHNCFSRCVSCCFPIFGFLLNLIIILPCCIFAVVFILFNNLCPELESTLSSIVNSGGDDNNEYYKTLLYNNIFPNKDVSKFSLARKLDSDTDPDLFSNLTELLLCEHNTPILELFDVGFDTNGIINNFKGEIGNSTKFDVPDGLTNKLDNYAENFDVEKNISSDHILLNHSQTIPKLQSIFNLKDQANTLNNIIASKEDNLTEVRRLMKSVVDFGSSIVPRTEELNNQTGELVDDLICEANSTLNDGLNSITCMTVKCVYSPFKNMLCVDLLSGLAYWIFSTVLLIIGIAILSITVCIRRRSMASSKIQNSSESEGSSSIDNFNDDDNDNDGDE